MVLAVLSFKITSWYSNQRATWTGDIQKSQVSLFSWSSWNSTTHSDLFDLCWMSVFSKLDASCIIFDLTLNFCIALARSQSRIDKVGNFAFNNFCWMVIDRFSLSVKNWTSLKTSSRIHRYFDEYFSVSGNNSWLCELLKVVNDINWEFLGQLKFAFYIHCWHFNLQFQWLLISSW